MPSYLKVKYIVEDRRYTTPCWIWQGCCRGGYGMINNPNYNGTGSKMLQAHIVYYEQVKGQVPSGLVLDHLCNVRNCINPDHMKPTTHVENIRRGKLPLINKETADEIRLLHTEGRLQKDLAEIYGISQPTISQIIRGVTWK